MQWRPFEAGFDWADASVLGLGERSGIARLERSWRPTLLSRKFRSGYNVDKVRGLCETVAKAVGLGIYRHHPVVGEGIFCCESGVHLDGIAKDPSTYEPYEPDLVSGTRSKMIGKKTGRNALLSEMTDLGVPASKDMAGLVLAKVKAQSRLMGRPLSEKEIRQLATYAGGGLCSK